MRQAGRAHMVPIARFLADVSLQAKHVNAVPRPADAILASVRANPGTRESVAMINATLAIIDCWGAIHESEINALSNKSLALLGQFGNERLRLRYTEQELDDLAARLKPLDASQRA